MPREQTYRAGASLEDYCRACKTDRLHTVVAADAEGRPIRVACDWCRSEHNYRGGPRLVAGGPAPARPTAGQAASAAGTGARPVVEPHAGGGDAAASSRAPRAAAPAPAEAGPQARRPFPLVSDRERSAPPMSSASDDFELVLRRIIREEAGLTPVAPAPKWRGGTLVLRPAAGGQEKSWPIESLFHKVVMIRNRLRTLEQQVNASELPADQKLKLQGYISGCYGSLTSFNVLFADEEDQFKGSGGDER